MSTRVDRLKKKYRLSTYALRIDVDEAEERLQARIAGLEERVGRLEQELRGPRADS